MNTVEIICIVVISILLIINTYLILKLKKRYEKLFIKIGNGEDLTKILEQYIRQVNSLEEKDKEIMDFCMKINEDQKLAISKVGVVKYNAYEDTRNKLSFSLALLNCNDDGVIINSVYSKEGSNIYLKNIIKGNSKNKLSEEEKEALEIAKK